MRVVFVIVFSRPGRCSGRSGDSCFVFPPPRLGASRTSTCIIHHNHTTRAPKRAPIQRAPSCPVIGLIYKALTRMTLHTIDFHIILRNRHYEESQFYSVRLSAFLPSQNCERFPMSTTIDKFLEPIHGPGADELHHALAKTVRSSSVGRYEDLGQIEIWQAFHAGRISSNVKMRAFLDKRFTPRWQAWLPCLASIIYSERQLESLYYSTLMTRVNIALHNAIPFDNPRVSIMACPGSFDSDLAESEVTAILPDWVVVEGTYAPYDAEVPVLRDLVQGGQIVAVGDTKLVQQHSNTDVRKEGERDRTTIVKGTNSCHPNWLAQVQHYAHVLGTRFGFLLTNKELVLAQFLREEESSPRVQRGLRSSTLPEQLHPGLPTDFESSDAKGSDDRDEHGGKPFRTPQLRQKRRYESDDSATLPRQPTTDDVAGLEVDRLPSSPPVLPPAYNISWSSPRSVLEVRVGAEGKARSSRANQPSSGPSGLPREKYPLRSSSPFIPSDRDMIIGKALVRSFKIPNSCDEKSSDSEEGEDRVHPAKALFALLMHAYSVGPEGRKIQEEETEF